MRIDLYRHGPKNNDPDMHVTGVEALLDPTKIELIRELARNIIESSKQYSTIQVVTSPVSRAVATGEIVFEVLKQSGYNVPDLKISSLVGSYEQREDKVINLSPQEMSNIWGEAKRQDSYKGQQAEHRPLFAWFEQGLTNPQAWNPFDENTWNKQDPGITLREISWRIGAFVYETLQDYDVNTRVVSFGHSGDIEEWIALTILMQQGLDNGKEGEYKLVEMFKKIRGALEPLSGVSILEEENQIYMIGEPLKDYDGRLEINENVLQTQAQLFEEYGVSNKVLEAKLG